MAAWSTASTEATTSSTGLMRPASNSCWPSQLAIALVLSSPSMSRPLVYSRALVSSDSGTSLSTICSSSPRIALTVSSALLGSTPA